MALDEHITIDIGDPVPSSPSFATASEGEDDVVLDIADDGDIVITFGGPSSVSPETEHFDDLSRFLSESDLARVAEDVLEGVAEDDRSRAEWLADRAAGLKLLGFKLEDPKSDMAGSSAPVDGMSVVRHPLLGEAVLHFQANALGELLPADGPAKARNWGAGDAEMDALADQLETDLNYYLTVTASEYVPDTDRMLFMVGYSGMAFKKVSRCPLRRRPVSECVDAEHLIVSNTATDLQNAPRVTHEVRMQPATFKRMQIAGVYRDIDVGPPETDTDVFGSAVARHAGVDLNVTRYEDQVRTIYEAYVFLDLPGFEHKDEAGKVTGLPLPYRVTIDKTSRRLLEIRRDWREGDEDYLRRRTFIPFKFVPAFGFYAIGLLQILGNTTSALTAAWRILLDAGMFSNFPGFMYARNGARQTNNSFRIPPGEGVPVDVPPGTRIQDAIMAPPYKGPDASLIQLTENIAGAGQRLGGAAELPSAEGRAETPVGTILALIEQALKVMDAVHKRLCAAQGQELECIRQLLLEDPEALWRGAAGRPAGLGWDREKALKALEAISIVPRADPNTPSHMHRLAKAGALVQFAQIMPPGLLDMRAVARRALTMMRVGDVDALITPPTPPDGRPSPEEMLGQAAMDANVIKQQQHQAQTALKHAELVTRTQLKEKELAAREEIERLKIAEKLVTHPDMQDMVMPMID